MAARTDPATPGRARCYPGGEVGRVAAHFAPFSWCGRRFPRHCEERGGGRLASAMTVGTVAGIRNEYDLW